MTTLRFKSKEELKFENELLRKEISLLKEYFTLTVELNTNQILQKLNSLSIETPDIVNKEETILNILNKTVKIKRVRLSLTEISNKMKLPESVTVRILDNLIEKESVKLYKNMEYGRIG